MRFFSVFVRLVVVGATLVAAGVVTSSPASAAPQGWLEEVRVANPGAEYVDADTVRLTNGVEVTVPAPSTIAAIPECTEANALCLWKNEDFVYRFRGDKMILQGCGFVNFGSQGWSDRVRSSYYNIGVNTFALFKNWNGLAWQDLGYLRGQTGLRTASFTATADAVHLCIQ